MEVKRRKTKERENVSQYLIKKTPIRCKYWLGISDVTRDGILALVAKKHVGMIDVIDLERGKKVTVVNTYRWLDKLKITPDGKKIVIVDYDAAITVWNIDDAVLLYGFGHATHFSSSEISHDSKRFFHMTDGRKLNIHSLEDGTLLHAVEIAVDGVIHGLATDGIDVSEHFSLSSVALAITMARQQDYITCMTTSADNRTLVMCCGNDDIVLINVDSGREIKRYSMTHRAIAIVSTSANNQFAIKASNDIIMLWNSDTGNTVYSADISQSHWERDNIFDYSPRRNMFAFPTQCGSIMMKTPDSSVMVKEPMVDITTALSFSRDGKKLYTFDGINAYTWDADPTPFWNTSNHGTFSSRDRKAISFLVKVKNSTPKTRKRKRDVSKFRELPLEILFHIFSFFKRE